jgi:hypothetical protein
MRKSRFTEAQMSIIRTCDIVGHAPSALKTSQSCKIHASSERQRVDYWVDKSNVY